jgi:hypothetical protein
MAFDFPSSPSVGQLYPAVAVIGQPQYRWNGTEWTAATFDPAGYVRKSGDVMTGALSLAGDPTQALHAVPKQYLDTKFQHIPLGGAKSFDITVPTGAKAMRFNCVIVPTSATTIIPIIQMSVAAGVFRTANADYASYGFYNTTGLTSIAYTGGVGLPGLQMCNSHTEANYHIYFEGTVTVKRANTNGRFMSTTRGFTADASNSYHGFLSAALISAASGSALDVLALRLLSTGGDIWGTDSFIQADWIG